MSQYTPLARPSSPLPLEYDFNPSGSKEAAEAWDCFGGLSIRKAHSLLHTNPEYYEEQFAQMGPVAFCYYFPVVDRFVREVDPKNHDDDREVRSLGYSIAAQLTAPIEASLHAEISDLAEFVFANLKFYSHHKTGRKKIQSAWQLVEKRLGKNLIL